MQSSQLNGEKLDQSFSLKVKSPSRLKSRNCQTCNSPSFSGFSDFLCQISFFQTLLKKSESHRSKKASKHVFCCPVEIIEAKKMVNYFFAQKSSETRDSLKKVSLEF